MVLKRANAGTATAGSGIDEGVILALGGQADVGAWGGRGNGTPNPRSICRPPGLSSVLAAAQKVRMATQEDGMSATPAIAAISRQLGFGLQKSAHAFSQQLCWACPTPPFCKAANQGN